MPLIKLMMMLVVVVVAAVQDDAEVLMAADGDDVGRHLIRQKVKTLLIVSCY
jgi:hypothetical protein